MPTFRSGDIVVWKSSRSDDLKRKVFRVTTLPAEYDRVVVENWRGHQRKISEYYLCHAKDYEHYLSFRREKASREEARARLRTTKCRQAEDAFAIRRNEITTLFKPI